MAINADATHTGMVLCVSQLGSQDQSSVRCIALLGSARLKRAWRISDVAQGSDCEIRLPAGDQRIAMIVLVKADGTNMVFELDWPIAELNLIDTLNRISDHVPDRSKARQNVSQGRSRMGQIIGFGARKRAAAEDRRGDLRATISGYLSRFGRQPTQPQASILLVGSPGSGKTTAINTVSTSKVHSTEVEATDTVAALKQRTTIALDYGECDVDGFRVRLYGTPGQMRFAHMIRQTLPTCDAVMILADATSSDPYGDICRYIQLLDGPGGGRPLLVAYTHLDQGSMPRDLRGRLTELLGRRITIIPLDPRDRGSVLRALSLLANNTGVKSREEHTPPAIGVARSA